MFIARVNTGNFEFEVVDTTEDDAIRNLLQGWRIHVKQTPGASPRVMTDLLRDGEVEVREIVPQVVYRDGSPLIGNVEALFNSTMDGHDPERSLG